MSSTPMNPTPFFGSKISLISNAEIRYEGILYTVDPQESTIALAQVRSMGSEDRIVDKHVPPRDEVYQYILFRASDIKDLIVDQPPAPALTDPAIIQAHTTSPSKQSASGSQSAAFTSSFPQSSSISAGSNASASLQHLQQQVGIPSLSAAVSVAANSSTSLAPGSSKPSQSQQQQQQSSANTNQQEQKPKLSSAQVVASGGSQNKQGQQQNNKQQQLPQRNNNANQMNRQQHQSHSQHQGNNRNQHQDGGSFGSNRLNFSRRVNNNPRMNGFNQRNGPPSFSNRSFNNRFPPRQPSGFNSYNRRQNNRNFVTRQNSKPTISLPDSEFDFEKAQDEFLQLEEKMANMKVNGEVSSGGDGNGEASTNAPVTTNLSSNATNKTEVEVAKDCYNREKSFFDKISCESLEKGNLQRVDWKAERKLNRETFGIVAPIRRNGYRPGSHRFGSGGSSGGAYRGFVNYRNRNQGNSIGSSGNKTNGIANSTNVTTSGSSTSTAASVVATSSSQIVSPAKN